MLGTQANPLAEKESKSKASLQFLSCRTLVSRFPTARKSKFPSRLFFPRMVSMFLRWGISGQVCFLRLLQKSTAYVHFRGKCQASPKPISCGHFKTFEKFAAEGRVPSHGKREIPSPDFTGVRKVGNPVRASESIPQDAKCVKNALGA